MNCPICETVQLVMSDRQGIEIDYCPQCRGVWLDRGELDKIIERSAGTSSRQESDRDSRDYERRSESRHEHHDSYRGDHYKKKKKGDFLSELFDFD